MNMAEWCRAEVHRSIMANSKNIPAMTSVDTSGKSELRRLFDRMLHAANLEAWGPTTLRIFQRRMDALFNEIKHRDEQRKALLNLMGEDSELRRLADKLATPSPQKDLVILELGSKRDE